MNPHNGIVVLGAFNPAIFSPSWVQANNIIEFDDKAEPHVNIMIDEISDLVISDINIFVDRKRAKLSSSVHSLQDLVGVVNRLFGEVLPHTPLSAIGMNIEQNIDFGSSEKQNELGRKLAPLEPWGDWTNDFDNDDYRLNGGMVTLIMRKTISADPRQYVELKVEPSRVPDLKERGVFFHGHTHFGLAQDADRPEDWNKQLLLFINGNFEEFKNTTTSLIKHLRGLVDA